MINGELKNQIDNVWDIFWSGGISDPLEVIEQINNLLFLRILDHLQTLEENKLTGSKSFFESHIFPEGNDPKGRPYVDLRWSHFKHFAPSEMFIVVKEHVFPFLQTLISDNSKYFILKSARFTISTPALLSKVVDLLDSIPIENDDTKCDLYEYMFSKIATTGQNGQLLTPHQIVQLMVENTGSQHKEVICDPACSSAGFLLATANQLKKLSKLRKIGVSSIEELTTTLQKEDIHFSTIEFPSLGRAITTAFGKKSDIFPIPEWLSTVFSTIVQGRTVNSICDPYARIGLLIGIMQEATKAKSVIAYTLDNSEAALGKVLVGNAEWRVKSPSDLLSSLTDETDIVASILPWGAIVPQSSINSSYDLEFKHDFGHLILIGLTRLN